MQKKPLKIYKFGGASLKDATSFHQMLKIVRKGKPNVVVVSAIDKSTNNFENIARGFVENRPDMLEEAFDKIIACHEAIIKELFPKDVSIMRNLEKVMAEINAHFQNGNGFNSYKMLRDQIMPQGEILSSRITSKFLNDNLYSNRLVDAIHFIKTDMHFGAANVNLDFSLKCFSKGEFLKCLKHDIPVITQGFIGGSSVKMENFRFSGYTTLGREGSDYTAGLSANMLVRSGMEVGEVVLWKNVPGIMDKDPNSSDGKNAKLLKELSYNKCEQLLGTVAKGIVHPKTLNALKEYRIPLKVKNFWLPELPGTIIH